MITIVLFGIVGFGIGYWLGCREDESIAGVFGFFGAFFSISVGFFLAAYIGSHQPKHVYENARYELAALQDGPEVSGSFFLGSGRIDEDFYYFYYRRISEGRYVMDKILADDVVIVEDGPPTPYLAEFAVRFVDPTWHRWAVVTEAPPTEIHVPEGSILQNYRLDLQ